MQRTTPRRSGHPRPWLAPTLAAAALASTAACAQPSPETTAPVCATADASEGEASGANISACIEAKVARLSFDLP